MSFSAYEQLRALTAAAAAGASICVLYELSKLLPGYSALLRMMKLTVLTLFSLWLVTLVALRSGQGLRGYMLCAVGAGFFLCRSVVHPIGFDAIKYIKQLLHIK